MYTVIYIYIYIVTVKSAYKELIGAMKTCSL